MKQSKTLSLLSAIWLSWTFSLGAQESEKPLVMRAVDFSITESNYYRDRGKWLAIHPERHKTATASAPFPYASGTYHVTLFVVGESDGQSTFQVSLNDSTLGDFKSPPSQKMFEEGSKFSRTWQNVRIGEGDRLTVHSQIASADGQEWSRGRWAALAFSPADAETRRVAKPIATTKATLNLQEHFSDPTVRRPDGNGDITISGELREWHKVTLTLDGPYAHELDRAPNPFTDYKMTVVFRHASDASEFTVPGYFAADGNAAQTGADSGTTWRAHLAPHKAGNWHYEVHFVRGNQVANSNSPGQSVAPYHGHKGKFTVKKTNKTFPDMRARGRLQYTGERYLRFAGTNEIFLKCGADAPENLFAYADFDGPFKTDGHKDQLIKTWEPHKRDWNPGDPSWQNGKGKGLVGAINYLASEGMNAFSFLTLNIIGDDRNVFPYTHYDERFAMDVSRLEQWEMVLEHGTRKGMFLHFKTQEAENTRLLDDGQLGPQRRLYYRELIARFGHHPALNWNLGEEVGYQVDIGTQMKKDWANYFWENDPYHHHMVIHNGNNHFDLLGPADKGGSALTGFSLQTNKPDFRNVHSATLRYLERSQAAGKIWAVACDEPGDATHSLLPDEEDPQHRDARVNALWGHFLAGGWGLEWYFGYKHSHSDLTCQDWRSRDLFWDQCRHALKFFKTANLPLDTMASADELIEGDAWCLAQPDGPYLVLLKTGGTVKLDLRKASQPLKSRWFNPRTGESVTGATVRHGGRVTIGPAPAEPDKDWIVLLK